VADAPWRCSQCGTVNEPVANACRTCGRWPSLFDLEQNTIEADSPDIEEDIYEARTVDVETLDPEDVDVGGDGVEMPTELEADDDDEPSPAKPGWQRFARLIVPIGVVLYILISSLANR
jgi:predicted  nucleic acid-binding Zn-ribbon protein